MNSLYKNLNTKEMDTVISSIAKVYRQAKKYMDLSAYSGYIRERQTEYDESRSIIALVNRSLQDCSRYTQLIIRKEYLENNKQEQWYLEYYSKTTYYRMRKKAMEEFLENMNL